ncbi:MULTISPECIES: hypothetical protein [unclassified Streptomyces]|uniref:hypothetical protein n=1 Tax=unclassified Streptomyces TaxID=2593676 RepID=UPI0033B7D1BD
MVEIKVEGRIAKVADFRGSFTAMKGTRVDALEAYWSNFQRPYTSVAADDCEALIDNRHLIGGDRAVRAKRMIPAPPPNAHLIQTGGADSGVCTLLCNTQVLSDGAMEAAIATARLEASIRPGTCTDVRPRAPSG